MKPREKSTPARSRKSPFRGFLDRLLRVPTAHYPLTTSALAIVDLPPPDSLRFGLRGAPIASVSVGDSVEPGQPLGQPDGTVRSPVVGKVVAVDLGPDVHGAKPNLGVSIAPAETPAARLPELDARGAAPEQLVERWSAVGVTDGAGGALADLLDRRSTDVVAVLAVDEEPGLCGAAQVARDRWTEVAAAARLLARVAGASRAAIVIADTMTGELGRPADGVELVSVPSLYPHSLPPLVMERLGGGVVVPVEAALAALDAVAGVVPSSKVVTVVAGGRPVANYRVALGTPIGAVLAAADIEPGAGDKVIVGGPLRGLTQYELTSPIDATVAGLVHIPAAQVLRWSGDPCVNCGACIDVCPRRLQVQLIGRYAEFGLFDRAEDLSVAACIDCGLCATVCTGNRPLLQLIRLAKHELGLDQSGIDFVARAHRAGPASAGPGNRESDRGQAEPRLREDEQ